MVLYREMVLALTDLIVRPKKSPQMFNYALKHKGDLLLFHTI